MSGYLITYYLVTQLFSHSTIWSLSEMLTQQQ
jgi:hypothetical protein